jgi:hypothetical protein
LMETKTWFWVQWACRIFRPVRTATPPQSWKYLTAPLAWIWPVGSEPQPPTLTFWPHPWSAARRSGSKDLQRRLPDETRC